MSNVSLIYLTHESEAEAQRISNLLLEARLVACANIFPIQSAYWWQGALENGSEWVSIVKTTPEKWEAVQKAVLQAHPYTTPCILKIEATANEAYAAWIRAEVSQN